MNLDAYQEVRFAPKGWGGDRRLAMHEVPVDSRVPQLAAMLDESAVTTRLQNGIPDEYINRTSRIAECRLIYVRYKLPRYCHFYYQLRVCSSRSKRSHTYLLGTKVFAHDPRSQGLIRRQMKRMGDSGSRVFLLHDNIIGTLLPSDLKIGSLSQFFSSHDLHRIVVSMSRDGTPHNGQRITPPIEVVSYRPERYCLVRFLIRSSKQDRPHPIFARAFHCDVDGRRVHRVMQRLWRQQLDGSAFSVAEPLGYDPQTRVLLQTALPGRPLTLLVQHSHFIERVADAARCLAAIHDTSIGEEPVRSLRDEWAETEVAVGELGRLVPKEYGRLNSILHAQYRSLAQFPHVTSCLLHGDFSTNQLLSDGKVLGVIDFNSSYHGDPLRDIATFLVRLRQHLDATKLQLVTREFCSRYATVRPGTIDTQRLIWHQVNACVKGAFAALKKLKPGWLETVSQQLSQAEAVLNSSTGIRE